MNPWLSPCLFNPAHAAGAPQYVLPCDYTDAFHEHNENPPADYKFRLELLPEPFIGLREAPVVLLNLNPGFDPRDPVVHQCPEFQVLLRKNYNHGPYGPSDFPFFFLDPSLENTPGGEWWGGPPKGKLRWLLGEFERKQLAQSIFCVEYFPYHSIHFPRWAESVELQSQQYGFELVRSAIDGGAVVVIMRGERLWKETLRRLEQVRPLRPDRRVFKLKNPQNVVVSPGNFDNPENFDDVVRAIREWEGPRIT